MKTVGYIPDNGAKDSTKKTDGKTDSAITDGKKTDGAGGSKQDNGAK